MAAVAFANSVRHACPACAWASGRRGRSRTQPDDRRRLPCLPFGPLDRRSAARPLRPLSFGRRGKRVRGARGISRPGERRPADPCEFCIRNGKERDPGRRSGVGSIMKPSWRRIKAPAPRSRRSNRPRQPPAGRGSAEAAHDGGAESPDRTATRRAAPRRADSFFGKNAFPT